MTMADLSGPQLTALSGTIAALSTLVVGDAGETLSPEEIASRVAGTIGAPAAGLRTPTPSRTASPSPTSGTLATAFTPSSTPAPTETDVPTEAVPTDEPTLPISICDLVSVPSFTIDGQEGTAWLYHSGSADTEITGLSAAWPDANGNIKKVELRGDQIWQGDDPSPANLSEWKSGSDRGVPAGGYSDLVFFFENVIEWSGYTFEIELQGECTIISNP